MRTLDELREARYLGQIFGEDQPPFVVDAWLAFVWWPLRRAVMSAVCRLRGHDITMDACITPDTGYEDWQCRRCGVGDRIIYY